VRLPEGSKSKKTNVFKYRIVPRKLLFELHYTAESSHNLMAKIISKEALCQEENLTSKT
jgi:hypothetical protein